MLHTFVLRVVPIYLALVFISAASFAAGADASDQAAAVYIPDSTFFTNGIVRAVHIHQGVLYIGGNFSRVYDAAGEYDRKNVAAYSLADRRVLSFNPRPGFGTVRTIAADGERVFIGGRFEYVNEQPCSKIAALDAGTGELIQGFRDSGGSIDGVVFALAYTSGTLVAAGNFTAVDGYARNYMAAFDGENGALDHEFDPSPEDPADFDGKLGAGVMSLAVHPCNDEIIFAGGNYRSMWGSSEYRFLAALTIAGRPGPQFDVSSRDPVIALDGHGHALYAGLAGFGNRAAAWEVGTAPYELMWKGFVAEGDVQAVTGADNGLVYFSFHQGLVDTTDYYRVAVLDGKNGGLFDTLPSMNSFFGVWALATDGNVLAAGGSFTQIAGRSHRYCAVFSIPEYSATKVPGVVQLLSPVDDDTVSGWIRFRWYLSAFASEYELQVANDSSFENIVCHREHVPDLDKWERLPGGRYWWRVRAVNGGVRSGWSAVETFVVPPGYEDLPQFVIPARTGVPVAFECIWHSVSSAESYRLQLSGSWDFQSVLFDSDYISDTSVYIAGLAPESEYYVRLQAMTAGGATDWNQKKFTTLEGKPGCVVGVTPAQGAEQISCHTFFAWTRISDDTRSSLEVALDREFSVRILDTVFTGQSICTSPELAVHTRYFWRVIVENTGGACTSSVYSFTTVLPLPSQPVLQFPPDGYVAEKEMLRLSWKGTDESVAQYRVECYIDSGSKVVILDSLIADTSVLLPSLAKGTHYDWRVMAGNASGWSDFTVPVGFSSALPEPEPSEKPSEEPSLPDITYTTTLSRVLFRGGRGYIRFGLARKGNVVFTLHTLRGVPVGEFRLGWRQPGNYSGWHSIGDVTAGIYYLRMHCSSGVKTVKAVVIR